MCREQNKIELYSGVEYITTMNNKYKVKRILWIIFDAVLIATGIIIAPIGILGWRKTGFILETWSVGSTFEGRLSFFTIMLGIIMVLYGVFDICVFRRSFKGNECNKC
jgi:hypothetical protein